MRELWRRLAYILQRGKVQRELEEEMAAHREMMGQERGRAFGSALKLREEANDAWGFGWWDRLWQDVRYGFRTMLRSPGFSLTAIAVLAFGIGVNVTAFEILNFFVLRPLPVKEPQSLMRLSRRSTENASSEVSYPEAEFVRANNHVFSAIMGRIQESTTLDGGEKLETHFISRNYLDELGMIPSYGRGLRTDVHEPGAVVLSYECFTRKFGGDSSWIGKTVRINKQPATIIGVGPAGFTGIGLHQVDVWAAIEDHPLYYPGSDFLTSHTSFPVRLYARLATGVSRKAAEDSLRPLVDSLRQQFPKDYWEGEWMPVDPGGSMERLDQGAIPALTLAGTLVFLVLATACANLGNLLLARAISRERELSIRTSVGAGRWRLVRQLLTESLLLSFFGAIAGLGLSIWTLQAMIWIYQPPIVVQDLTPDWRVLAFAGGAALLATLLFGLAPALQATRRTGKQSNRLRTILIATQVAASCALVIVSGLLMRGLHRGLATDPGFTVEQAATIDPNLYAVARKGEAARAYLDQMQNSIRNIPGVEAITLATLSPFGGRTALLLHEIGKIAFNEVDGSYFETLQIPLLAGRTFQAGDQEVAIVSERLAQRLWPGESPLGKVFRTSNPKDQWVVVGVARNAPVIQFGDSDAMEVYRPLKRPEDAFVIVRAINISAVRAAIQQAANNVDPKVLPRVTLVRENFELRLRDRKMATGAITLLGAAAMLLAMIGLAGLISYTVTQRTKEIGIRMALGASRNGAMMVGVQRLLWPIAAGIAIGMVGAWALGTGLRSQLFGLSAVDPLSYAIALAVFSAFSIASSLGPLLRAAKVDPAIALRHD